jgi:16S rRNA (uracil1498-N3)-methyltransferase
MLQSQQTWLPTLHEPLKFNEFIKNDSYQKKFIAHCEDGEKMFLHQQISTSANQLICIGPEGDFTKHEIESAKQNNFIPVTLGNTRLRTETAGMVACVLLNQAI